MAKKAKGEKSETIVVSSEKAQERDFFNSMIAFQYGTPEESDAGFNKAKKLAQSKKTNRKRGH